MAAIAGHVAEFLAGDAVIGKALGDQRAHGAFGRSISLGYRVEGAVAGLVVDGATLREARQGLAASGQGQIAG